MSQSNQAKSRKRAFFHQQQKDIAKNLHELEKLFENKNTHGKVGVEPESQTKAKQNGFDSTDTVQDSKVVTDEPLMRAFQNSISFLKGQSLSHEAAEEIVRIAAEIRLSRTDCGVMQ